MHRHVHKHLHTAAVTRPGRGHLGHFAARQRPIPGLGRGELWGVEGLGGWWWRGLVTEGGPRLCRGVWLALCTPLPTCAGGGVSSSYRVGSWLTGCPLPQLFSLQLDSDPGLPHTGAIHSSFCARPWGWAGPWPGLFQLPQLLSQLRWAERGRQGGGKGSEVSPCPPPQPVVPSGPRFLTLPGEPGCHHPLLDWAREDTPSSLWPPADVPGSNAG